MGRFFASRFFQTPGLQEFYLTSFGGGGGHFTPRRIFFQSICLVSIYFAPISHYFAKMSVPKGVLFF